MRKWLKLGFVVLAVGMAVSSVRAEPQYIDSDGCTGPLMTREWEAGGWTIMCNYY